MSLVRTEDGSVAASISTTLTSRAACFSADGGKAFVADDDNAVSVWTLGNGGVALFKSLVGHKDSAMGVSVLQSTPFVVTSSWDATLRLWDYSNGECVAKWDYGTQNQPLFGAHFSPNGRTLAASSEDGTIKCWSH